MTFQYVLYIIGTRSNVATTPDLVHIDEMENIADLNDAQHRGERWEEWSSSTSMDEEDFKSGLASSSSSISSSRTISSSSSSDASSAETKELRRATQTYRTCYACPDDMMKKHTNRGIKWICGGYQRARRSFKSVCMMRYRNCQDGTMFVKLYDHRCKNSTHHGRHFFYVYKT